MTAKRVTAASRWDPGFIALLLKNFNAEDNAAVYSAIAPAHRGGATSRLRRPLWTSGLESHSARREFIAPGAQRRNNLEHMRGSHHNTTHSSGSLSTRPDPFGAMAVQKCTLT